MKKTKQDKDFRERINKRRKRARKKELFTLVLLLLLPAFLACLILFSSLYSFRISLLLIYFLLPMFYTIEKRIRCLVSGIGNPKFSFADGYKAFFKSNRGGVFGVISSFFSAFCIGLASYLLVYRVSTPLINAFPAANVAFQNIKDAMADGDRQKLSLAINQNRASLSQPLSIRIGIIFFLPIPALFFGIDRNLSNHYLSGIVLPDIDNNISAAQARSLCRGSYGAPTASLRRKKFFSRNWPYFLLYSLVYGLSLYGVTTIRVTDSSLVPLIRRITPMVSLFFAFLLNVFVLINCYSLVEESQDIVLSTLPPARKVSIYQTYCNPNYVHGEESAARGCFIPADQGTGAGQFYSPFDHPEDFFTQKEEEKKDSTEGNPNPQEPKPDDSEPSGGVFDFTKDKKDSEKK